MTDFLTRERDLHDKVALVTGGTKGIGRAIADRLSKAGAKVIVTARNRPLDGTPPHPFIAADLMTAEGIAIVANTVHQDFGGADILIDNVGGLTSPGGGFSALTDEHWEQEWKFNLLPAIRLDRAILPGMLEKKSGVIIHVSSVAGRVPYWQLNMAYAAAKAALNSYSKALANEVAGKGVRVLTVSPGATATEGLKQFLEHAAGDSGASSNEVFSQLASQFGGLPMDRMAEPEEIASLIGFLVSPGASYLTSTNITIDGGSVNVV